MIGARPPIPAPVSRKHRNVLAIALAVIVLSFALRVDGSRVSLWCAKGAPLPELCGARAWLGVSCPGCGLTRSFIHLAHGRWHAAYVCHPMGWILALLTVLQIPYRLSCLVRGPMFTTAQGWWMTWAVIGGLILNWGLGQANCFTVSVNNHGHIYVKIATFRVDPGEFIKVVGKCDCSEKNSEILYFNVDSDPIFPDRELLTGNRQHG